MTALEAEHVDVPLRGTFHVEHAQCDVIDAFDLNHAANFALIELSRTLNSVNEYA
jgi:hypothetical protein